MTEELSAATTLVVDTIRDEDAALRRFVRGRVHPDDVDDVLQMAALRAILRADSLQEHTRVVPWLYRLYRNVAADAGRKRAHRLRLFDSDAEVPDPMVMAPEASCRCSLSQAQTLSEGYARILEMVDVSGDSLREVATALGISVNNATVRLHRARKALRKRMLEHCGVSSLRECFDCRCGTESCCIA